MEYLALLLFLPLFLSGDLGSTSSDDDETSGTEGDDELIGGSGDDSINGQGGQDELIGGGGDDTLRGGDGDDIVDGGTGNDELRGGDQNDLVQGFDGDDVLYGGDGDDLALGEAGNDTVWLGEGDDLAWVDDEINAELFATGQLGDVTVYGEAGNDGIWDYDGANTLYGGDGNDDVVLLDNTWAAVDFRSHDLGDGGEGNDFMLADSGDTLIGGAGADSFNVIFRDASYDGVTSVNDTAAVVEDFDGAVDFLGVQYLTEGNTDPEAPLTATTDPDTGDVTLSVDGVDLVILTAPTNFNLSEVQFQVN